MGEEASKRDRVVSQHDQDIEEINDVWNTFQLPIPIPRKVGEGSIRQTDDQKEWLLQVVDQLRLLQTMKDQFANPNNDGAPYRSSSSSKYQRMKGQINLAFSGQARIEQTFPSSPPMTNNHNNNNDTTIPDDGDKQESIFFENAHRLVQSMREETEDICGKFHEWLSRHPEQELQMKYNVIANIFFAPLEPVATQDDPLDDFSDEGDGDGVDVEEDEDLNNADESPVLIQKRSQPTTRRAIPNTRQHRNEDIDPVEFQKQQQELLEEELSSMATQLKSSTLAMNATLQTQTKDLEGMEDIAQANLDNVSSTTKKVEQRLAKNKGWKKKLATWSVIFTVIGMWILCFMIMRTIPKRKIGNVRVVGWKSWKRFITVQSGRLKDRLDMLLNGESFDSHWEQSKATHEKNGQRHKQQQQRQQNNQRQECEILPDGSQQCRERDVSDTPDAKAQQFLAERKQRRIEENMANARKVEAMDPADIPDEVEVEEDENIDCIPPTPPMQGLLKALKGMSNARNELTKHYKKSDEGSKERQSFMLSFQGLLSDYEKHVTALERAQDAARAEFWSGREQRAVEDISFCTTDTDITEFEQNEAEWMALSEMIRAEEDRSRIAQEKEAKLQKEAEEDRLRKEAVAKRKAEQEAAEARRKAEEEAAAEARKRAEEVAAAAKRMAEEEAAAAAARKKAEEEAAAEARKRAEEEAATKRKAEEEAAEARRKAEEEAAAEARKKAEEEAAAEAIIQEQNRLVDLHKQIQIEARKAVQAAEQVEESDGFRASDLRFAASKGQNNLLALYISEMPDWIDASDAGGWRPLHEAARAGNLVGVELLISAGCDISSRTGRSGNGGTALWWAIQRFGENHDVVALLRFHNALEAGPAKN
jgi:hypothetical protein